MIKNVKICYTAIIISSTPRIFIGGKVKEFENIINASYRELEEETGITNKDIMLNYIQTETVTVDTAKDRTELKYWTMCITAGILKHDVELKAEKNQLYWLPLDNTLELLKFYGDENCFTYFLRACRKLGIEHSYKEMEIL